MTRQEYREASRDVIYLAACAVNSERPDPERIKKMDLARVYKAAQNNQLAAAVGMALESAGIKDDVFVQAVASAQRKNALLDADRAAVLARMEEAGIWYMPLKGAVLKDMYPRYGMREMADNDILFDAAQAEALRQIMTGLGFTVEDFDDGTHDVYLKKPVSCFEMHRRLFSTSLREDLGAYYDRVKDRLIPDEGKRFGYHFSDEDFYLYVIAHENKHYFLSGTGIRSILDTYVCLTRLKLDMDYVCREAEKIGIADYERRNRSLALKLFSGKALNAEDEEMLEYVMISDSSGNADAAAEFRVKQKGRWGYFLSRLTISREGMEAMFPFLKKAPFLYPVCWVLRLFRGVLFHNKAFRTQMRAVLGLNRDKR